MTTSGEICIYISIFLLLFMLMVFIFTNCIQTERFTAPGLTLTVPPSWFPQNAAKPYKMNDWKVRMYLDRYPFYDSREQKYISEPRSDYLASTNRYWVD